MGPGFLLEEFGRRSGEEQKPDHTGTSLKKGEKQLLPQPAADFGSKVHNGHGEDPEDREADRERDSRCF